MINAKETKTERIYTAPQFVEEAASRGYSSAAFARAYTKSTGYKRTFNESDLFTLCRLNMERDLSHASRRSVC